MRYAEMHGIGAEVGESDQVVFRHRCRILVDYISLVLCGDSPRSIVKLGEVEETA
jgi:hypothetical protein